MFDVVNDVALYQDYLPSCSRSEVIESAPGMMMARLTLTKAGVSQQFTTRNKLVGPKELIFSWSRALSPHSMVTGCSAN